MSKLLFSMFDIILDILNIKPQLDSGINNNQQINLLLNSFPN